MQTMQTNEANVQRDEGKGQRAIIVVVLDSVKVLDVCVVLHASVLCIAVRALVFKLGPIEASAEMLKLAHWSWRRSKEGSSKLKSEEPTG